jgi:GT2 family glycosyltransferase
MNGPIAFIISWQRPLYLWACLDSLYRNTKVPCRFVLIDNASADPVVHQVIEAFEARGLFHRVHKRTENSPRALPEAIKAYAESGELSDYFCKIDGDVVVLPGEPCWLERFMQVADSNPEFAMLGSLVDKSDFVDPVWAAKRFPGITPDQLSFLVKDKSPERKLQESYTEPLIDPFNPPGRLMYLKREMIERGGLLRDKLLYESAKRLGYEAAIVTSVRHRHLSFQNLYDYPEIDVAGRNQFFKGLEGQDR